MWGRGDVRHLSQRSAQWVCRFVAAFTGDLRRKFRMPLSFHAVSFGNDSYTGKLRRMVQIAQEVEKSAPQNSLTKSIPSSFTEALDTASVRVIFGFQTLTCISLGPPNRDIPRVC